MGGVWGEGAAWGHLGKHWVREEIGVWNESEGHENSQKHQHLRTKEDLVGGHRKCAGKPRREKSWFVEPVFQTCMTSW